MSEARVISLKQYRDLKEAEGQDPAYRDLISKMSKLELLEEMVRFKEERLKIGHLTLPMMVRGKILFAALETHAETQELRILTRSYRRHLEHEMETLKSGSRSS